MTTESCSNCAYYKKNEEGDFFCNDCDGLYFMWFRQPEQHCPDYKEKRDVQDLKTVK